MSQPDVKTPACEAGVIGAAVSKGIDGSNPIKHGRIGRGIRAYEAAKTELLSLELTPSAYMLACRQAADAAEV